MCGFVNLRGFILIFYLEHSQVQGGMVKPMGQPNLSNGLSIILNAYTILLLGIFYDKKIIQLKGAFKF
jgi:hypothetical protein